MLGKTHMVVGAAATIAFTQPDTILEMLMAVGMGVIGSDISDIDIETSDARRIVDRLILISVALIVGICVCDSLFNTRIIEIMIQDSGYGRIVSGTLIFLAICAFGKFQPHRSFMHSFLALALLDISLFIIWDKLVIYFTIGFLSHLFLDILNKKKLNLLYPLSNGVALELCCANGIVNKVLLIIGSIVCIIEAVMFLMHLLI